MSKYTFIDLFSGIGGVRLGFEKANCECVCSIEIDKEAGKTYNENFGNYPLSYDIRWKSTDTMPDFDILCGGFPCQPFSHSGYREGFSDKTSGNLFFEIIRILKNKQPKAYFLENVYGLLTNDNGNTFRIVRESIEKLGYSFYYQIINSKLLVPQNRERVYMVGFKDRTIDFKFPNIPDLKPKLRNILETNVSEKYTLTNSMWKCLLKHREDSKKKGNGFGYTITDANGNANTLSARYYKDGSEILINKEINNEIIVHNMQPRSPDRPSAGRGGSGHLTRNDEITYCLDASTQQVVEINSNPRRLTPRECARLQGFPDTFKIVVSDAHAYHQFGNSVTVPIIEYLAKELVRTLNEKPKRIEPYSIQKNMMDY